MEEVRIVIHLFCGKRHVIDVHGRVLVAVLDAELVNLGAWVRGVDSPAVGSLPGAGMPGDPEDQASETPGLGWKDHHVTDGHQAK